MQHKGCKCRGLAQDPHSRCRKHREERGQYCAPGKTCKECETLPESQWAALQSAQRKQERQRRQNKGELDPSDDFMSPQKSRKKSPSPDRQSHASSSKARGSRRGHEERESGRKRRHSRSPGAKRPKLDQPSTSGSRKKVTGCRTPPPAILSLGCAHVPECRSFAQHDAIIQAEARDIDRAQDEAVQARENQWVHEQWKCRHQPPCLTGAQHDRRDREDLERLREQRDLLKREQTRLTSMLQKTGMRSSQEDMFDNTEPLTQRSPPRDTSMLEKLELQEVPRAASKSSKRGGGNKAREQECQVSRSPKRRHRSRSGSSSSLASVASRARSTSGRRRRRSGFRKGSSSPYARNKSRSRSRSRSSSVGARHQACRGQAHAAARRDAACV